MGESINLWELLLGSVFAFALGSPMVGMALSSAVFTDLFGALISWRMEKELSEESGKKFWIVGFPISGGIFGQVVYSLYENYLQKYLAKKFDIESLFAASSLQKSFKPSEDRNQRTSSPPWDSSVLENEANVVQFDFPANGIFGHGQNFLNAFTKRLGRAYALQFGGNDNLKRCPDVDQVADLTSVGWYL